MNRFAFEPERYESQLVPLLLRLRALVDRTGAEPVDALRLQKILRRYPKDGRGLFSKSEIIQGYRHFREKLEWPAETGFVEKLRMKPVRTLSGVAPVTVLTKPYPCPGKCIFCPSDVRMPKSYLSNEPGAQRAAQHRFDPYGQTMSRLLAYHGNGHRVDKVELIVLGGTWSYYPESLQIWFVKRCFDAMNDFDAAAASRDRVSPDDSPAALAYEMNDRQVDGRLADRSYNRIVRRFAQEHEEEHSDDGDDGHESASWAELESAQRINENAACRCVGLVVETRPDHLDAAETVRIRRLGATKVQIGYQSLSDEVLRLNHRGHDVAATRRAMRLLRGAGFKIHAHWMPNLYGSTPQKDVEDFERIFADPDFRPDELKIYPCSLIESAELMAYYEEGRWRPYEHEELLELLTACMSRTPEYCRITRVIRDIPGTDIVAGNRLTNFRELAEREIEERKLEARDVRSREVRERSVDASSLVLRQVEYEASGGREIFLQYVTPSDHLAGFLRLRLPGGLARIDEIRGHAMIREVHVYGLLLGLGERNDGRSQHTGLGRHLVEEAKKIARRGGYQRVAVISSVGTRGYYRSLGFEDGTLYQHVSTEQRGPTRHEVVKAAVL